MFFRKMHFGWLRVYIEISKVIRPKFAGLVSPNAIEIAVNKVKIPF